MYIIFIKLFLYYSFSKNNENFIKILNNKQTKLIKIKIKLINFKINKKYLNFDEMFKQHVI